ncbi:MAG: DUF1800 domain-containing protein [Bacteroidota bacterium]
MKGSEKIKHLYWRAGFGLTPREWETRRHWTVERAVDELFDHASQASALQLDGLTENRSVEELKKLRGKKLDQAKNEGKLQIVELNNGWIKRMVDSRESALLERLCLFWHGHFACELKTPKPALAHLNMLRQHALGNFRDFVKAVARDVAMIRYLNNQQNRKSRPNENFARELLELFTIGRGNYTEKDIKEVARAFTGWSSDARGEYVFRSRQHDYGVKTVFDQSGKFDGDEIVDLILRQKATARFVCYKVYRYFVNERVEERIVEELAEDFYASDYDLARLFRRVFTSDWFYAPANVGTKIKSPIDLMVGMMRSLDVQFGNPKSISFAQRILGQVLFRPPNVAGWPRGKNWIDNATLLLRLNLAESLYNEAEVSFQVKDLKATSASRRLRKMEARTDFQPLVDLYGRGTETEIFTALKDYFLVGSAAIQAQQLAPYVLHDRTENYLKSVTLRLLSLPEYQLC